MHWRWTYIEVVGKVVVCGCRKMLFQLRKNSLAFTKSKTTSKSALGPQCLELLNGVNSSSDSHPIWEVHSAKNMPPKSKVSFNHSETVSNLIKGPHGSANYLISKIFEGNHYKGPHTQKMIVNNYLVLSKSNSIFYKNDNNNNDINHLRR
jgi:hypothetical protein